VAISSDGKRIAGGTFDGTVVLWDAETGREMGSLKVSDQMVYSVRFRPDESLAASSSRGVRIYLMAASEGGRMAVEPRKPAGIGPG
jgi:WD40 repeat protein